MTDKFNGAAQRTVTPAREHDLGSKLAARARIFYGLIAKQLCEDDRVVDFGGGDGLAAEVFEQVSGHPVEVIDALPERVNVARASGLQAQEGQLERLPLDDVSVDWGYCSHTLEHTVDLLAACTELARVISQGLFVVVPLQTDAERAEDPAHNHNSPDAEWWIAQIESAGFKRIWHHVIDYAATLDVDGRELLALFLKADVYAEAEAEREAGEAAAHAAAVRQRVHRVAQRLGDALVPGQRWLDFGGGAGDAADELRQTTGISMTIVDLDADKIDRALSLGLDAVCADVCATGLPDASYDWVFTSHTLEHIVDLDAAIKEMSRIARCGAYVIVPLQDPADQAVVDFYKSHVNFIPTPEGWAERLLANGFASLAHSSTERYFNNLPEADLIVLKENA